MRTTNQLFPQTQDTTSVQSSLSKAISPTFEIVFAGAFSAGKSMLINALLERELLYSAEGHATGTECYIAYAEPDKERVVLTFLSEVEISAQVTALCQRLGLAAQTNINQSEVMNLLREGCQAIILVYKTSGLLGFYGSQIKQTSKDNHFGLDTVFAKSVKGTASQEETPQFIFEFNKYCVSGKLSPSNFRISVHLLPMLGQSNLLPVSADIEVFSLSPARVSVFNSNGIRDAVEVER